ncbi:MAG: hypothetical protein QME74_09460, partial [Candidatus Edwardsbacteria bacterium]|nr:hypothetical protein [Candidatus Edwardsbacteria bacterium]
MTTRLRNITPWLAIGLVIALIAAGIIHVSRPSFRAGLLARANRGLSAALKRQFTIGGAAYRFPLAIAITDIAIAARDSVAHGCLARIPEIRVNADPVRSLLNQRFTVGSVSINGARFDLEQFRDGTWNFSGVFQSDSSQPKGKTSFPPLALSSISVRDLAITLRTPAAAETIDRVGLKLGLKMGGAKLLADIYDFQASDRKRHFNISKITGRLSVSGDTVKAEKLRVLARGSSLDLTAWMESKGKRLSVTACKAAFDLRDAAALTGAPVSSWSGRIDLDATADGTMDSPQGLLSISSSPGLIGGISIDGIAAKISLANRAARVENLVVMAGGGRITAVVRLDHR